MKSNRMKFCLQSLIIIMIFSMSIKNITFNYETDSIDTEKMDQMSGDSRYSLIPLSAQSQSISPNKIWEHKTSDTSYTRGVDFSNGVIFEAGYTDVTLDRYFRSTNISDHEILNTYTSSNYWTNDILVLTGIAYLSSILSSSSSSYRNRFRTFNVSNPNNIQYLDDWNGYYEGYPVGVYHAQIIENIAYLSTDEGFYSLDISDPTDIFELGHYNDCGDIESTAINGDIAFLGDYNGNITMINISIPNNPVKIGEFSISTYSKGYLATGGDFLYISYYDKFFVINISDIQNPVQISSYDYPYSEYSSDIQIDRDYVFVSRIDHGLTIFDISDPSNPIPHQYGETVYSIKIRDGLGYVASGDGIEIIDIGYDTDGDNLTDYDEDNLYLTNKFKSDSDDDGMPDNYEIQYGFNPNDDSDNVTDFDSDGLSNVLEFQYSTNPILDDTDSDGLLDGEELLIFGTDPFNSDSDNDGVLDGLEINSYGSDPLLIDTDYDGLSDWSEIYSYSTDPNNTDSDNDNLTDGFEILTSHSNPNSNDTDNDNLLDWFEYFVSHTDISASDSDQDGLLDYEEIYIHYTNPLNNDSDYDYLTDFEELILFNTDPWSNDSDSDEFLDIVELWWGSDPNNSSDFPHNLAPGEMPPEPDPYISPENQKYTDEDFLNAPLEVSSILGLSILFGSCISLLPYLIKFIKKQIVNPKKRRILGEI